MLFLRYEQLAGPDPEAIAAIGEVLRKEPIRFEQLHQLSPRFFRSARDSANITEFEKRCPELFWLRSGATMASLDFVDRDRFVGFPTISIDSSEEIISALRAAKSSSAPSARDDEQHRLAEFERAGPRNLGFTLAHRRQQWAREGLRRRGNVGRGSISVWQEVRVPAARSGRSERTTRQGTPVEERSSGRVIADGWGVAGSRQVRDVLAGTAVADHRRLATQAITIRGVP
jgi:hypothetical protein